jgi:hypothetical protein
MTIRPCRTNRRSAPARREYAGGLDTEASRDAGHQRALAFEIHAVEH